MDRGVRCTYACCSFRFELGFFKEREETPCFNLEQNRSWANMPGISMWWIKDSFLVTF